MKKPFFGFVAAASAVALTVLGASAANAESKVGQSILSPDIPAQTMTATEMEDVEGQGWRWRWRIASAGDVEESSSSDPVPVTNFSGTVGDVDATVDVVDINDGSGNTFTSVSTSTTCSGTCSSSSSAIVGNWWW